jgi:hypothetical protein
MARRYQKKTTKPPKHLRIDVTRIKQQCICDLNGLCLCPPSSNGQTSTKNGEMKNGDNTTFTSPSS